VELSAKDPKSNGAVAETSSTTTTNGATNPKLVIVESPAKARTLEKFLGDGYKVRASLGHVRDLPERRFGVDIENDFAPTYVVPSKKKAQVALLKREVKQASELYLATDPDREGEAIAWHLLQVTKPKVDVKRVVFHEITRDAVTEAFQHPRGIDYNLVDAQQARRVLDRLVGYKVSPLLWAKVRKGLSAGRVQSVAVRLLVEREREIQAFKPQEYWTIEAELARRTGKKRDQFRANLIERGGERLEIKNQAEAEAIVQDLQGAEFYVGEVRKREVQRQPAPPFITSTLQQEAGRKLGYSAGRTMAIAQQLYEGLDIGPEGRVGLITYMRTDSTNVAVSAQAEARAFIERHFGTAYVPPQPRVFKTKTKGAQEAHEAIRPTSVERTPESIRQYLEPDQFKLYSLIWRRFVASQMAAAVMDTTSVDILARKSAWEAPYLFRATGSVVKFPGFLAVYQESTDEAEPAEEEGGRRLPELVKDEPLDLLQLLPEQHFTQPPPRYTEASLIKALEEYGIGRPSTYAPTITNITTRGYVQKQGRQLRPTELAMVVNDLLVEHFSDIFNVNFTAQMEEMLDQIARGEEAWVPVLRRFYDPFFRLLQHAEQNIEKVEFKPEPTGEPCPQCGKELVIKLGRFGRFIACSGFPECRYSRSILEKIGVPCPQCGAEIVERKTRRGRTFYGCERYPDCTFALWNRPVAQRCPQCGSLMTRQKGNRVGCTNQECGYSQAFEEAPVQAEVVGG
jgi:DNA topoisomerase-1